MRRIFLILFLFLQIYPLFSTDFFEEGKLLFMENRPEEAIGHLELAFPDHKDDENIYLYLGTASLQIKKYEKALDYFERGAAVSLYRKDIFYYNSANIYYLLKNYGKAEEYYTLALDAESSNYKAYLNRANARLSLGNEAGALEDYRLFLALDPDNYQSENIKKLIAILEKKKAYEEALERKRQEEIAAEEERKRLAEEKRKEELRAAEEKQREELRIAEEKRREELRLAEEKRLMEEEKKKELLRLEEERRKALLEDALDSLKNAGTETKGISAGSEEIPDFEEDLELDD